MGHRAFFVRIVIVHRFAASYTYLYPPSGRVGRGSGRGGLARHMERTTQFACPWPLPSLGLDPPGGRVKSNVVFA